MATNALNGFFFEIESNIVGLDFLVDFLLLGGHGRVENVFSLFRQIGLDIVLDTAKKKGFEDCMERGYGSALAVAGHVFLVPFFALDI